MWKKLLSITGDEKWKKKPFEKLTFYEWRVHSRNKKEKLEKNCTFNFKRHLSAKKS